MAFLASSSSSLIQIPSTIELTPTPSSSTQNINISKGIPSNNPKRPKMAYPYGLNLGGGLNYYHQHSPIQGYPGAGIDNSWITGLGGTYGVSALCMNRGSRYGSVSSPYMDNQLAGYISAQQRMAGGSLRGAGYFPMTNGQGRHGIP
jgi:hypothetical protein